MDRFICENCGSTFSDPIIHKVSDIELPYQIETYHCPFCGSEDYADAVECDTCGLYFPRYKTTEGTCNSCIDESIRQMHQYMESGTQMEEKYRRAFLNYFNLL